MNRKDNDNQNRSRWEALESLLGTKLPALPSSEHMDLWKDTSWVGDYVQNMLEKSMPKKGMINAFQPQEEVFQTHNYVIVKINMENNSNPIVKIRADQVKIDGLRNNKSQIIRLPCHVIPHLSRASYKDGILQIKMRKKKISTAYHEVSVRYL
ncbi:hypothetical protein SK3146_06721 [Paenibacillus konkukensis]|uniref:Hsp20/alpha crystallin family protein n=1 Tax=Paenibacillus konkukensis TaxID=2020716 RepID=A0ABY4S0T2_9BACL|nr:Hsp20/alpha crystallin family protein [Paenibacillus konkukensis]UQZ87424.1 hypothetical protein SK3146_06721 [Paenibacillus konkukensis]